MSATALSRDETPGTVYWATAPGDLVAIFEPQVQILVHPRPPEARIADYLDRAGPARLEFRRILEAPDALLGAPPDAWPSGSGREALLGDLADLAELYCDLLGCERLGLRFEALEESMCPGFHRDRTGIRLVCTYRGPGTEWLDDGSCDWDPNLHRRTPPSGAPVGQAPAFAVTLLKGCLWQGNAGRGTIHRSPTPPPGSGTRYLVVLDALW